MHYTVVLCSYYKVTQYCCIIVITIDTILLYYKGVTVNTVHIRVIQLKLVLIV